MSGKGKWLRIKLGEEEEWREEEAGHRVGGEERGGRYKGGY